MRTKRRAGGFSLIELMITVAVVAIIAMIMLPKMSQLIRKGNEAGTHGQLGAVRGALRIYFFDTEENFPNDIGVILSPGNRYYNGPMPIAFTAEHGKRQNVNQEASLVADADTGEWGYVSEGEDKGRFWIQCTHADLKGTVWSSY